jgi:NAD(P)-dependent dehydrogenase (short-subunit alcohol dehydrogenase family)
MAMVRLHLAVASVAVAVLGFSLGAVGDLAAQVPASEIEGREVIMITGSTDGIGRAVALQVASEGAHVIVHGRSVARGDSVVAAVRAAGGTARFYQADLGSLVQVRELANSILRDYPRLDVLVNNAGIGRGMPDAPREVSADGYELRFAVNYLSHYYLTLQLMPLLLQSAPSRVVSTSSSAQGSGTIDFDNVMLEREPYEGAFAYSQSKLAQIFMTFDLNEEYGARGVTFNAVHPGGLLNTSMVRERGGEATMPPEEGAAFIVAAIKTPQTGQYFNADQAARAADQAYDAEARRRLREMALRMMDEAL